MRRPSTWKMRPFSRLRTVLINWLTLGYRDDFEGVLMPKV